MREDPIISAGALKLALVLLVAGVLGAGAYAVAGGDIDLPELPELPEIETETTELEDTTVEERRPDAEEEEPKEERSGPFTTAGLGDAIEAVREESGSVELIKVAINETQTQFITRTGDGIEAHSVRADDGELVTEEAEVTITGEATLEDFAFPLQAVRPAAIDRMLAAARRLSGAADFEPTVLSLERAISFGSRMLRWQLSAEGGGKFLTYRARADGRRLEPAGAGTAIPPAARRARELNDCIQAAGEDTDAVRECFDQFR